LQNPRAYSQSKSLILLFGNILNTGSRNEQSVGFDISYLPKLGSTKDRNNKGSLMTFLVEIIETSHPELINFYVIVKLKSTFQFQLSLCFQDELLHVDKASKVSADNVQKVLRQIENLLKMLENDLENRSEQNTDPKDKFTESLGTFCMIARTEYTQLVAMSNKMGALYSDLSVYFVFDKQKYSLDQFFGDIKQFKDQFKQVYST
jgi:hypothetical protein